MEGGFYKAAKTYRDSIIEWSHQLAGDEVGEAMAWQDKAGALSRELRRYAIFLSDAIEGRIAGPIVFPSWRESLEDHRSR